jgi:hypothetical protein
MTTIPNYHNVNLLADPKDPTAQLLQFAISLEHLQFPNTSDRHFLISVFRLSLMLSLHFSVNFQVDVEFLSRFLYEFLAHKPFYHLRYDRAIAKS